MVTFMKFKVMSMLWALLLNSFGQKQFSKFFFQNLEKKGEETRYLSPTCFNKYIEKGTECKKGKLKTANRDSRFYI